MGRRHRARAVSVVGLVGVVACTFSARVGGTGDDDDDAMPMCGGMTCSWGCIDNRCAVVAPAGGGVTPDDTRPETFAALDDIVLSSGTIDGSAGMITGVTGGFTFAPRARGTIGVFRMKSLTINGQVKLAGSAAIAIVTDGPIVVNAVVDAKGPCSNNENAAPPGPGGFAGATGSGSSAAGSGGGGGGLAKAGAGGGGNGGRGGSGGTGPASAIGGAGGAIAGSPMIDVLFGGGGGGCTDGNGGRGFGGGGGGAVQLVSNTKITIASSGGIDAGGCPGDSGQGAGEDGGGGGGAGGTILLEAPLVEGEGRLAVNGGGGGAGDDATNATGFKSTLSRTQAGGANSTATGGGGGSGAAGAAPAVKGDDDTNTHAGGGGGGIGRIRFNTRDGTVAFTGSASPSLGDPASTCTAGTASTR